MTDSYYGPQAYDSGNIPDQPPSQARSWIEKFAKTRLPWGDTQDVAPNAMMTYFSPSTLRHNERVDQERAAGTYVPKLLDHLDFHQHFDHERYRSAQLSNASHFWIYLHTIGKWAFILFAPMYLLTGMAFAFYSNKPFWDDLYEDLQSGLYVFVPLLSCWVIGALVMRFLPKWWLRPSRGPLWEFNRRSGLVTLFDYDNNGLYKKQGAIGELSAPFYEFDAYLSTHPDRQGLPMNFLYLANRYRRLTFSLATLVPMDDLTGPHFALWDFLQNYMDISKPLPDIPALEAYRSLDPTTAEHDRQSGRAPRYWRDMDDEEFKRQRKAMLGRCGQLDTLSRLNLMYSHVRYQD